VKKRESQVGELDQLKLKTVVLHNNRDSEIHMTQPVESLLQIWYQLMVEFFEARLNELHVA